MIDQKVVRMTHSINFNLFLLDGEVTGRVKCTQLNWTGLAFKIPRSQLDKCKSRSDLKQSGVYFLFGKNDEGEEEVYIGQAVNRKNGEGVLNRVVEHLKDPLYFTEAVILTTQNASFGPTEISYLENKFTNMAKEIGRYFVRNSNEPNLGNVTEEKESELSEFIDHAKMVLGVLGYKVFVPMIKKEEPQRFDQADDELPLFLIRNTNQPVHAKCMRTDEGFVLLKGSLIHPKVVESAPKSTKELRALCQRNLAIINNQLTKNLLFTSPSSAAAFVMGASVNGRLYWKTQTGVSLKELEDQEREVLSTTN